MGRGERGGRDEEREGVKRGQRKEGGRREREEGRDRRRGRGDWICSDGATDEVKTWRVVSSVRYV
jgi:hypothetical protein